MLESQHSNPFEFDFFNKWNEQVWNFGQVAALSDMRQRSAKKHCTERESWAMWKGRNKGSAWVPISKILGRTWNSMKLVRLKKKNMSAKRTANVGSCLVIIPSIKLLGQGYLLHSPWISPKFHRIGTFTSCKLPYCWSDVIVTLPTKISITNRGISPWLATSPLEAACFGSGVGPLEITTKENGKNFILDKTGKDSIYHSG